MSFFRTAAGVCKYHFFVWSNLNYSHISQSCQVLYSLCVNLLNSLIMWLMVLSLSPRNLHFLYCCVLGFLALIWLIFMALFCAVIRRDSVSLLKFPFLSHVQDFSCKMLFISRLKRPEICFPSPFCFQVFIIYLVSVVSIIFNGCNQSFMFSMQSSSHLSMRQNCLQCWQVLPLFLIQIFCQRRPFDVLAYAWSLISLFFGPFA